MKIKLDSKDVLEITRAIKGGWLDMGKVEAFKHLLKAYNPPKAITDKELNYYLDSLNKGCGYTPTSLVDINQKMFNELPAEVLEEWRDQIADGSIYREVVKSAYLGMIAINGLGGTYADKEPDYSFIESDVNF